MPDNDLSPSSLDADAWIEQSKALLEKKNFVEAEIALRTAICLFPGNAELQIELGNLLSLPRILRREEAAAAYHHSLMAGHENGVPFLNLGRLALELNALDVAERYTIAAIEANPELKLATNNLATVHIRRGNMQKAYEYYEKAFSEEPDMPLLRFNIATLQLLFGDESGKGWENYEARFEALPDIWKGPFDAPYWNGEKLRPEQPLLLHHEQGLGDVLQCLRYIDEVKKRCARIILWIPSALIPLLPARTDLEIVDHRPENFAAHCPLFSLPRVLGKKASGEAVPYIHSQQEKQTFWREWLDRATGNSGYPRIGFVWSGNPMHLNDFYRSLPFEHLSQLLHLKGIDWVCLQKDNVKEEVNEWLEANEIINPMPEVKEFADTAAILDALDLLITIDSSVAHLAGAMGRPTWLLLPGNPDWRWDIRFPDSTPWYPTLRLFRQDRPGDWNNVLSAVYQELVKQFAITAPNWETLPVHPEQDPQPCLLNHVSPDADPALVRAVAQLPLWQHRIPLPGLTTPGHAPISPAAFDLPESMEGLRVLDVGARDGFWSFEALRRGARQVIAIDDFSDRQGIPVGCPFPTWENFDLCRDALGYDEERCQRHTMSVYEVSEELLGRFDVIFCYGVLHQLRHPLLGLDKLAAVCDGELRIETPLLDDFSPYRGGLGKGYDQGDMIMEFYPGREYAGNPAVKWIPTLQTLGFMLHSAGFENVEGWKFEEKPRLLHHCRGFVTARR